MTQTIEHKLGKNAEKLLDAAHKLTRNRRHSEREGIASLLLAAAALARACKFTSDEWFEITDMSWQEIQNQ